MLPTALPRRQNLGAADLFKRGNMAWNRVMGPECSTPSIKRKTKQRGLGLIMKGHTEDIGIDVFLKMLKLEFRKTTIVGADSRIGNNL
jgi:hypothetical protein